MKRLLTYLFLVLGLGLVSNVDAKADCGQVIAQNNQMSSQSTRCDLIKLERLPTIVLEVLSNTL